MSDDYSKLRFMAHDAPSGKKCTRISKFFAARGCTLVVFATATQLCDHVRELMTEHPDAVCVVQNPPHESNLYLPLASAVSTIEEAIIEIMPYNLTHRDDRTPMVVWFTTDRAAVSAEVSLDHQKPTPCAPQLASLSLK